MILPIEIKKRRRGRNFLNVPFPIGIGRQESIILRKIIKVAGMTKSNLSIGERLAFHIVQTLKGTGALVEDRKEKLQILK